MIEISEEINYIELYYTLRCNLGCDYCINKSSGVIRNRNEIQAEIFANSINKINLKKLPLTIGGGEPTLREDFYEFINLLNDNIKIDLLTNLSFDVDYFIKNIKPSRFFSNEINKTSYKSIRVSYHPKYMNANELVNKAKILQNNGYNIGIFGINHPLNMESNIEMAEIARINKIYFFIKDFLGVYENQTFGFFHHLDGMSGIAKNCKCRSKEILISPEAKIYKCHRDLYNNEFEVYNLLNEMSKIEYVMRDCNKFGFCNPCDLKIKANRYLKMGFHTTDIEI